MGETGPKLSTGVTRHNGSSGQKPLILFGFGYGISALRCPPSRTDYALLPRYVYGTYVLLDITQLIKQIVKTLVGRSAKRVDAGTLSDENQVTTIGDYHLAILSGTEKPTTALRPHKHSVGRVLYHTVILSVSY